MSIEAAIGIAAALIGLGCTVGGIFIRMGTLMSQVKENTKDIAGIGMKVNELSEKTETKMDRLRNEVSELNIHMAKVAATISGKKCLFHEEKNDE